MMRCRDILRLLAWLAFAAAWLLAPAQAGQQLVVLAFHDVRTNVRETFATDPDASAVDVTLLAGLFDWFRAHGWQPVSLEQVVRARAQGVPLPDRPVLLTFDDGYASAHDKVYPLLREFGYPAVMALVTSWLEVPSGGIVPYGDGSLPRERFLEWAQVRAMAASGLVEFATHTHDLHRGVTGNPQGNLMPAAATHTWREGRYEDDATWLARVERDLRQARDVFKSRLGHAPRAIAWPYGAWNAGTAQVAAGLGMPVGFGLGTGSNADDAPLHGLRRLYVTYDMDLAAIAAELEPVAGADPMRFLHRAVHVDLDYVHDPDPAQQERNLSLLVDRIASIGPRAVYLQAFADPDGDGVADALYFPNRHLPLRADLFSRVAWQLRTRARVEVYAWMPVLALRLPPGHPARDDRVVAADAPHAQARYERLSPFSARARGVIKEIYDDLGRHASFAGVLFHDDATLAEDEDAGPGAVAAYGQAGFPVPLARIRADADLAARWAAFKAGHLTAFTQELAAQLRRWQPQLRTGRNVYAQALLEPRSVEWLAQDFAGAIPAYDYTVVMAMPSMEQEARPLEWLTRLARLALVSPLARERVVFELQARDWRTGRAVPDAELERQAMAIQRQGIRHLAYYPDDFVLGQPSLPVARRNFSVRDTYASPPRAQGLPEATRLPGTAVTP